MKVYKFGGASLCDAKGFERVGSIIQANSDPELVVVVSAIGKTTNHLEKIYASIQNGEVPEVSIRQLAQQHEGIALELIKESTVALQKIEACVQVIREAIHFDGSPDALYDLIVSQGEILSSVLVHQYLDQIIPGSRWLDARSLIVTDERHREGNVNWPVTESNIVQALAGQKGIFITQGFIASTVTGKITTLGRDGSDYSAAIFASCLKASNVTIWKDVPGVMNADPKRITDAVVFPELPYREAAEMTYYGASVIHPKTIKPLANKNIPLLVKSFVDPELPGTLIHECRVEKLPPLVVFKDNQCLISCKGTDYTFITENQLSDIFRMVSSSGVRINVMQNSAISFSFCIDYRENRVQPLIERLSRSFEVFYNTGLTLITVKNYTQEIFDQYRKQSGVLLEQSSRSTLQILVR